MHQHTFMANRLMTVLASARDQLAAAATAFWQRRTSLNEIDHLGLQEKACLARDLGISADDLRILAGKDSYAADLLYRRMQTLGLNAARIDPAVMRDLQRGCSKCLDRGRCVHELEDRPREPTWPNYCPNEQTLAALTEEQAHSDGSPGEDPTVRP